MKIPKDIHIWDNTHEKDGVKYIFHQSKVLHEFNNPSTKGMSCTTEPTHEYCHSLSKEEYVKYKLLGYLDSYEEKRISRKNAKTKNKRSKSSAKA